MRSGIALAVCAVIVALALPGRAAAVTWCGTDEAALDRHPDAVASYEFHVIYAHPSDRPDRFFQVVSPIASDVAAVQRWWRREDPSRAPRFDLFAFPGCADVDGSLDVSVEHLPGTTAYYGEADTSFSRLWVDVAREDASMPYKKYLVYYDGPVDGPICGEASTSYPDRGGTIEAVYLERADGRCGSIGNAGYMAATAAHEMIHDMGALPTPGPRNPCVGDLAHVCDSGFDILFGHGGIGGLFDNVLDYHRDDYYGHGGSWPDVRNSLWLRHLDAAQFPLSVQVVGAQTAEVTSEPSGVECPPACTTTWDAGSRVSLVALDSTGARRFMRWSGACTGISDRCTVTMDAATAVTASVVVFAPRLLTLAVNIRGRGRVAGTVKCAAARCRRGISPGSVARLRAVPSRGARFVGWRGACHGRGGCVVRMRRSASVTAVFSR